VPDRSIDRYRKTIRRELAGQNHGVDGAGADTGGLAIVFYSIIHAILNANVLNVMRNPELDRRFGIQTVEPYEIKQGVSHATLSRFFGLPIETVRRRADRLKKEGILRETDHGLIVTEANQFKFGNNHELQKTNILLVRKFLRDLMEAGIELPGGV
jgi:hypothetical protein